MTEPARTADAARGPPKDHRMRCVPLRLPAVTAVLVVSLPPLLHAQEEPVTILPDQVITATRVPTLAESIPAGVTVIDRATIEERGYVTLSQALASVPGVQVVQQGGQGGESSVFIRGSNSNHVLVLRDGVPINDPSDPGGLFNFGVDTLGDVERIEVVRGPMSSLYGSGAIGGVINLITRRGEGEPHATTTVAAGAPAAVLGGATLSGVTGKFDYSLGVESGSQQGFDTTPQRESVHTGARNGYRANIGTIELGYTPVDGTRFFTMLRGRTAVFGLDELGSPAYDANDYTGRDNNVFGRVGATTTLLNGALESWLFLARIQSDRRYIEALEAADPNQASGDSRYVGRRTDLQWNNTLHLDSYTQGLPWLHDASVTVGYEHIADDASSSINTASALTPFGTPVPFSSSVHASETSDAAHAGVQGTLFHRLTLTGDIRNESATFGGQAFTWRAGGVLAVPELWLRLKSSYGTAFRAPSLFDLFGVDSFNYRGNPNLQPERSKGWEAGFAVDLPGAGRQDLATLEVTYFNNYIQDLIEVVFAPDFSSSTSENVARARTQGVESSLTIRPANWLEFVGTYTYTDARDLADNSLLLRRPLNAASLNVKANPVPQLTLAPELVWTGAFQDFLVDNEGFSAAVGRSRGGLIANLTVTYDLAPKFQVFVSGRNLGNSHFEPASGFQTPGTSFLAGVRARI
jgi:vitamin B12 transporter